VLLFSENAISETKVEGKTILKLSSRKEMAQVFENFLREKETVSHFNGQQTVKINGYKATGICYCTITLIDSENGKKIRTIIGAIYEDEYIRVENPWLVSKRVSNFRWQEKREIK